MVPGAEDKSGDSHVLKQLQRDFALKNVLRLVMDARLAPPADDKQHRDGVNLFMQKGGDGVDDISLAGILHIHHRDPPVARW